MILKVLKVLNLIALLYSLRSIYFVKSAPNTDSKNFVKGPNLKIYNSRENRCLTKSCISNVKSVPIYNVNVPEYLKSVPYNESELYNKLTAFINYKMIKMEENITKNINTNMDKLENTMKNMNEFNQLRIEMDKMQLYKVKEKLKCSNVSKHRNCYNFQGCKSNIYNIMLPEVRSEPFLVACDFETLGGGWTIIQRRRDGSEDFFRNWKDYVEGFGNVNGEYFIGLKKLHALTTSDDPQELYIILENFDGEKAYANYKLFEVDSERMDYKLTVGEYSGDAGDSLAYHNGMKFSTRDRDNDDYAEVNCANGWKGAWWYKRCYFSNLNGRYYRGEKINTEGGIVWRTFGGLNSSLKFTQMMIRKKEGY